MLAALTNGLFLDKNFARWCKRLKVPIRKGRQQDLSAFPIEKVRLQIAIPAAYMTCAMVLVWGWVLNAEGPLGVLLAVLFCTTFSMSVAFNVTSTLLVDFYPKSPATATAANNLVRCLLGAGATAAVIPMIDAIGRGWTFTCVAVLLLVGSPMLWLVYFKGMKWRGQRKVREEEAARRKERRKAGRGEEGKSGLVVEGGDGRVEGAAVLEEEKERQEGCERSRQEEKDKGG